MTTELPKKLHRPMNVDLDAILGTAFGVLDHGFVRVIDYMGDDKAIVQAARVSYGAGTKAVSEDIGLIRYLMRHAHTTPFEMAEIKLHLKMPIFVARQWIRHRMASINEYSARYSILAREFYVPEPAVIGKQSKTNKQGREDGTDDVRPDEVAKHMRDSANTQFDLYDLLLNEDEFGVARELGRIVLPLSTYTEFYWKIDLHNLLHFLRLRTDPHAQAEIRAFADPIESIVKVWCPASFHAYVDYRKEAVTFSRQEVEVIRAMLGDRPHKELLAALSARELAEFWVKVDRVQQ